MGDDDDMLAAPPSEGSDDAGWLTSFGDLMSLLLVFFILMVSPQAVVSEDQREKKEDLDKAVEQIKTEAVNSGIDNEIKVESQGNTAKLTLQETLLFPPGKARLTAANIAHLKKVLEPLKKLKDSHSFDIHGHTDATPIHSKKFPSNWYLSTARALAILDKFIQEGFPPEKLTAMGYAQYKPVAPEYDKDKRPIPENRAKNRRVEIYIK